MTRTVILIAMLVAFLAPASQAQSNSPQEGTTSQVLQGIQLANEEHARQQLQLQQQQLQLQQRQAQQPANVPPIQTQAPTPAKTSEQIANEEAEKTRFMAEFVNDPKKVITEIVAAQEAANEKELRDLRDAYNKLAAYVLAHEASNPVSTLPSVQVVSPAPIPPPIHCTAHTYPWGTTTTDCY